MSFATKSLASDSRNLNTDKGPSENVAYISSTKWEILVQWQTRKLYVLLHGMHEIILLCALINKKTKDLDSMLLEFDMLSIEKCWNFLRCIVKRFFMFSARRRNDFTSFNNQESRLKNTENYIMGKVLFFREKTKTTLPKYCS